MRFCCCLYSWQIVIRCALLETQSVHGYIILCTEVWHNQSVSSVYIIRAAILHGMKGILAAVCSVHWACLSQFSVSIFWQENRLETCILCVCWGRGGRGGGWVICMCPTEIMFLVNYRSINDPLTFDPVVLGLSWVGQHKVDESRACSGGHSLPPQPRWGRSEGTALPPLHGISGEKCKDETLCVHGTPTCMRW